ncbi:hypothetical protein V1294_007073 [Bradyrhizobium sp. AZCC 1678]|uniref:hypothetical protein n=1 Tax=Bradyrhizobium sp. AZCC 1678 TaxID=3117030 RepID=UPI002FF1E599
MVSTMRALRTICAGVFLTGILAIAGSGAASAQVTASFNPITNQFGSTITLDTASCSPSGSIFPTFSINNNGTGSGTGTSSNGSMSCTVRYQSGSFGCQFQMQVSTFSSGFATAGAYKGSGGRPQCSVVTTSGPGDNFTASFKMQ